jgi:peptidyl-prolyl cis-trans isomerase A (cyclophilin A)
MRAGTRTFVALLALVGTAGGGAATARAEGDPANGKFTIGEATKGLTGSGPLMAEVKTSMGTFDCELFEKDAPNTVANFVGLARGLRPWKDPKSGQWVSKPFYDGLIFHRVIPGFMIQGGDPKGNGTGDPGYEIKDEKNDPHKFDKGGVMAMANRGPDTGGSQFFITEGPTPMLDDGARPGAHYQIFGQCKDPDLVKQIAAVQRDARDKPNQDVTIQSVKISRGAKGKGKGSKK